MAQRQRHYPDKKSVADLMPSAVHVTRVKADSRKGALTELVNALAIHGVIDLSREREAREAVLERDNASTAIGGGLAIPHQKNKYAHHFGIVVGLAPDGIDFGARDGLDVKLIFCWICPPASTPEHLALMRALASVARDEDVVTALARCRDRRTLMAALSDIEVETKGK